MSCCDFREWWRSQTGERLVTSRTVELFLESRLSKHTNVFPIDPSLYARRLGCAVTIDDVPAGRLEVSKTRQLIRLPNHYSSNKQRFVAAHELAHLLLLEDDHDGVRCPFTLVGSRTLTVDRRKYVERIRLENLCDYIARVMLVPRDLLPTNEFARRPSLRQLLSLANTFDVPLAIVFQRLVDEAYLSRYPGWVLLSYAPNYITGGESKWRVAARAIPRAEVTRFPKPNQSLEVLRVELPPPSGDLNSLARKAFEFEMGGRRWTFCVEDADDDNEFWLLASISFSTRRGKPRSPAAPKSPINANR